MSDADPDPLMSGCVTSIHNMRDAGMSDVQIAFCLSEIRSAAIAEERLRVERLAREHPPRHMPALNIKTYLMQQMPRDETPT